MTFVERQVIHFLILYYFWWYGSKSVYFLVILAKVQCWQGMKPTGPSIHSPYPTWKMCACTSISCQVMASRKNKKRPIRKWTFPHIISRQNKLVRTVLHMRFYSLFELCFDHHVLKILFCICTLFCGFLTQLNWCAVISSTNSPGINKVMTDRRGV